MLSNDPFISVFFLGLMEFPSIVISYLSLKYFKRKTQIFTIGGFGSILSLASIFFNPNVHWQAVMRIVFGCIAKIAITVSNQSSMVFQFELLPTSHRSFGFTLLALANFITLMAATFTNKLSVIYYFLPMLIYVTFAWISSIPVFYYLPETKDLPIPETLEDMRWLKRGNEDNYLYYMNNKTELVKRALIDSWESKSDITNEHTSLVNRKLD